MPADTPQIIEAAKHYLLSPLKELEEAKLPAQQTARLMRLREAYAWWLQNPRAEDKDVIDILKNKYGMSYVMAYQDLQLVKICLGEMSRLTKDYDRYLFRRRCEEGWAMAREKNDARAFASVTAAYGKYTQLDKDENIGPDYSLIVPQTFVITSDPAAAGIKVAPGLLERARKLERQYIREAEVDELPATYEESVKESAATKNKPTEEA